MGRKKGKVRWTSVEEGFFAEDGSTMKIDDTQAKNGYLSDENTNSSVNGGSNFNHSQNRPHQGPYYSHSYRRNYNRRHIWANGGVAPRFERKASESRGSYAQDFEGEEQLPNGFYKIRSKNLDVLFKKDYYAHRSHLCMTQMFPNGQHVTEGGDDSLPEGSHPSHLNIEEESSGIDANYHSNQNPDEPVSICVTTDPSSREATEHRCASWVASSHSSDEANLQCSITVSDEASIVSSSKIEMDNCGEQAAYSNLEAENVEAGQALEEDVNHELSQECEAEKKDSDGPKKSTINENASPFYPSGYIPPTSPMFMQHPSGNPPTLYLYTPGAQSIVPCDEIVITSPIIAPDGTTLFPNPSNVYLPFDGMMNGMQFLGPQVTPSGLIQYDQYGVPYTTYHQQQPLMSMVSPGGESAASPPVVVDSEEGSAAYLSESSTDNCSVESTPNTPPDLSVYSPANWNVPEGYAQAQWFPQQYFYQQQPYSSKPMYSKNRGPNIYYQSNRPVSYHERDGNWIPSSTGESLAGDDDESRRRIASRGSKEERKWGERPKQENKEQPSQKFIPGLPESMVLAAKKVQKKRRKKKVLGGPSTPQTNEENSMEKVQDNGNLSSSEDDLCQIGDHEAVEAAAENSQMNPELVQTEVMEAVIEAEIPAAQEPVCVKIIEEVVDVREVESAHKEPQARPIRRSRSKRAGGGGQRQRFPPASTQISEQITTDAKTTTQKEVQIVNDDQWEIVPNEIKESKFDEWETSIRGKRSRKGGRQFQVQYLPVSEMYTVDDTSKIQGQCLSYEKEPSGLDPNQSQESSETHQPDEGEKFQEEETTKQTKLKVHPETHQTKLVQESPQVSKQQQQHPPKQVKQAQKQQSKQPPKPSESKLDKDPTPKITKTEKKIVEQSSQVRSQTPDPDPEDKTDIISQTSERSASVSSIPSATATLKKKSKKKPAGDENKSDRLSSSVRQVLVHDGMLNFADPGIAGARRLLKRPNDLINEHAFVLKDIGHGMRVGPMGTGRINQGKYQPPDRSAEILFQFMKQQREKVMQEARLQFATQPLKITKLLEITDPKQQQQPESCQTVVVDQAGENTHDLDLD